MKKLFLGMSAFCTMLLFTGCGQVEKAKEAVTNAVEEATATRTVDYRMFENKEETQKVFDEVVVKLGDQAKVVDKIDIYIRRPAHEGTIKRAGEEDELNITIETQDPTNPKRIQQTRYWSDRGWQAPEQMEINVIGSSKAKESFRLEDELFDFSEKVNFDTFFKVMSDAYAKHKDTAKYEYQYIRSIKIDKKGYDVTIYGRLAANEQEKNNYYRADFTGKGK